MAIRAGIHWFAFCPLLQGVVLRAVALVNRGSASCLRCWDISDSTCWRCSAYPYVWEALTYHQLAALGKGGGFQRISSVRTDTASASSISTVDTMSNSWPWTPLCVLSIMWRYRLPGTENLSVTACWTFRFHQFMRIIPMSYLHITTVRWQYGT